MTRSGTVGLVALGVACVAALSVVSAAPRVGTKAGPVGAVSVVVPAFVDHHVHVFNVGWWLLQAQRHDLNHVSVGNAKSEAEVVQRVATAAGNSRPGWITGFGWNQEAWGTSVLPSLNAISTAIGRVPVALARTDGHALWVNRAALDAAGLSSVSTGVLLERAVEPVVARIPAPPDSDIATAWRLGAEALAARGVLRVYDAGVLALPGVAAMNTDFARYARVLAQADRQRALPIAIHLMIPAPSRYAESVLAMSATARRLSPNVRITHLKLFADGAFGSRGAALSHAYADDPHTHGVLRMTSREIAQWARRALDAGLDVATHAIGDQAVKEVLDAYEMVLRERPRLVPGRLRIEHFSYAREGDFARAVRLGVALSVQSNFNTPRGVSPTFAEQRLGVANAPRAYAWDRLDRMGALLVEGSDYFGEPGAPMAGMQAGLTGINAIGDRGDTPAVRMRLIGLTRAWLAPGGGLELGGGDSVALSGDPLAVSLDSLRGIRVLSVQRRVTPPGLSPARRIR
ncbi:MAG: amidohydrolase family protein [Gemmatimonadaceae bacterium]|nr:amidohydrolase family protein [Gemmatimonadaceae bacterium]